MLPREAEYSIANRKSHLRSSATVTLWDTSDCRALRRKVGVIVVGVGVILVLLRHLPKTLIGLA